MFNKYISYLIFLLSIVSTSVAQVDTKINMERKPALVRMMVMEKDPIKRMPFKSLKPGSDEWNTEKNRMIQNIVILVHGHNEAEKAGWNLASPELNTVGFPWFIDYKRDVWTNLYTEYFSDYRYQLNDEWTAFYEFIYPTYLPIYEGFGNLSDAFASQLTSEMDRFLNVGMRPNIFIVAHSMGGLVARAAIQKFTPEMHEAFQKLVTWGTPHHGSALVSTRFAAEGPYKRIPISPTSNVINFPLVSWYLTGLQLNTPGTRDLLWDNIHPLELDAIFEIPTGKKIDLTKYSLSKGNWLYNKSTQRLNESDVYRGPTAKKNKLFQKKYAFLYGLTTKRAPVCVADICWGATATALVIDGYFNDKMLKSANDGAVPIASMTGSGINAELLPVGDIDHEEYFGAPLAGNPGKFRTPEKAKIVAKTTLEALHLSDFVYKWIEKVPGSYIIKFSFSVERANPDPFPKSFTWMEPGFHTPEDGIRITPGKDSSFSFQFEEVQQGYPGEPRPYINRQIKVEATGKIGKINSVKGTISIEGKWTSNRKATTSDYDLLDQPESGNFKISGTFDKVLIPDEQVERLELSMEGGWTGSLLLVPGKNTPKDWSLNATGSGKCPSKITLWLTIRP